MYDYGYNYGYEATTDALGTGLAIAGTFFIIMWLIGLAIGVFALICNWKVYKKAGKEGWAVLIPVYNIIVLLEIVELPLWYIALFFIPFANVYALIKINLELAKKFGKSTGFAIGLILFKPIFIAILAFSKDANYVGNVSNQQTYQQPNQNFNQQPVNPMNQQVETPVQNVQPAPVVTPVEPTEPVVANEVPTQSVEQSAFCTNCGNKLMPGAKFCTSCGKQV